MKNKGVTYMSFGLALLLTFSINAKSGHAASFAEEMELNFNAGWKFKLGEMPKPPIGAEFDDSRWEDVSLPHTLIQSHRWMLDGDPKREEKLATNQFPAPPDDNLQSTYHRTVGWYRKSFDLPESCQSKNIFLSFEGVMQTAKVWINGEPAGEHEISGYTPFHFDITSLVTPGRKNIVTVLVDNTTKKYTPPDPHTKDYMQFGGIYRNVHLVITDKMYITFPWEERNAGVQITLPAVSKKEATVNVRTSVRNSYNKEKTCRLETTVVDAQGRSVLSMKESVVIPPGAKHTFEQTSKTIKAPHLWHPSDPYLYTVRSSVYDGNSLVAVNEEPLGFRWVKFDLETGFSINGKKLFIDGHCRHHHYPFVGEAVPDRYQRFDAMQIRKAGNGVRTSHYPQAPAFLDECDRLGLLVLEEPPTWIEKGDEIWLKNLEEAHRRMIRRDRNHPSIVTWAVCINHKGPVKELVDASKEDDPTRQLAKYDFGLQMCYGSGVPNKGGVASEYPNWHGEWYRWDEKSMLGQTEQWLKKLSRMKAAPDCSGAYSWVMYDYNTLRNCYYQKAICPNGLVDQYRIPKYTYYAYQAQHDPEPMVFIADRWNQSRQQKHVEVYSNCDEVELLLNGVSLGKMEQADDLPEIEHPPFRKEVAFSPGKLEARGFINGKVAATHLVRTQSEPVALKLESDFDTIIADGADWTRIIASVVDKDGTVVCDYQWNKREYLPDNSSVKFSITGNGKLVGDNPVLLEAGRMIILAQSTMEPGEMTIKAESEGVKSAETTIVTFKNKN